MTPQDSKGLGNGELLPVQDEGVKGTCASSNGSEMWSSSSQSGENDGTESERLSAGVGEEEEVGDWTAGRGGGNATITVTV